MTPEVVIEAPSYIGVTTSSGSFVYNEIVTGGTSGATARVKEYDQDTHILKISNVSIGSTQTIGFYPGETIIGQTSGAEYPVFSYVQDDTYDKYTENDEFETLGDNLLDFTETNPFGTF